MSSTVLCTMARTSTQALVVTSPATITTPVLTSVSQATRPLTSAARMASRMASEIWSATLSGWPSDTDSEVKEKLLLMRRIPCCLAKIVPIPAVELRLGNAVILRSARLDLDRAHQGRDPARALLGVDHRPLGALGHHQGIDLRRDISDRVTGLLLQQTPLIVVDRHPAGLGDEGFELLGAEHGHALAGVENKGNLRGGKLRRMLDHGLAAVRGHDAERDAGSGIGHPIQVGMLHCSGVKGRDLVVIEVGGDEGLSGKGVVHRLDVVEGDALGLHVVAVRPKIMAS